jgi:hypothetical protein
MAWNPNIPQPTDSLSQSQADILANFQALDPLFNDGVQNWVTLPVQGSAPATAASELALYSKSVSGTPQLFMRQQSNGTEFDFTSAGATTNGWARLPSGIILKWGQAAMPSGGSSAQPSQTVTYPVGASIPVFTTVFQVFLSQIWTTNQTSIGSNGFGLNASTTTNFKVTWSGNNSSGATLCYLAIGI